MSTTHPSGRPPRCLVAIATYNEIENLPALVDKVLTVMPDCDLLVVDDNSPDGTGRWCESQSQTNPRLHTIIRPAKLGLGTAVVQAMQFAIDRRYDLLLTMDADHSHDPSEIDRLVSSVADADVAIGSRYVTGGQITNWPWYRRCASRMANLFARQILGVKIHDCSGGFRCYRVAKLRELDLEAISSTGYSFYEEIVWRLQLAGAKFIEVPITFTDRQAGKSKAGIGQVIAAMGNLLTLRLRG